MYYTVIGLNYLSYNYAVDAFTMCLFHYAQKHVSAMCHLHYMIGLHYLPL